MEEEEERMVKTPWAEEEIPFTQAAQIGTDKVMNDHSTIGLVITTDGSFGELPRSAFLPAEEKTILALKKIQKPFLVLLNSQKPYSEDARRIAAQIEEKYQVSVLTVNCEQLKKEDINRILENILYEFPISVMEFYIPKWVEMLPRENPLKQDIVEAVRKLGSRYNKVRDVMTQPVKPESEYVCRTKVDGINMQDGTVQVSLTVDEKYYYEMLTEVIGDTIRDEYELIRKWKEFAAMKKEYALVADAMQMVRMKGMEW